MKLSNAALFMVMAGMLSEVGLAQPIELTSAQMDRVTSGYAGVSVAAGAAIDGSSGYAKTTSRASSRSNGGRTSDRVGLYFKYEVAYGFSYGLACCRGDSSIEITAEAYAGDGDRTSAKTYAYTLSSPNYSRGTGRAFSRSITRVYNP